VLAGLESDSPQLSVHPMRNVLTNVLGARDHTDIHLSERQLSSGEMLLLCSDGVHNVLDDATLCRLMSQDASLETIGRSVIAAALERGTRDNVTVIVARYEESAGG
jgi:PPM family protein phosphatase